MSSGGVSDTPALVAWLRQQLDEDERHAAAIIERRPEPWGIDEEYAGPLTGGVALVDAQGEPVAVVRGSYVADVLSEWGPARVLREVAAKRKLLDECVRELADDPTGETARWTLAVLAEPYSDRPGYRESWRPDHRD